jgi:hypothetical protein
VANYNFSNTNQRKSKSPNQTSQKEKDAHRIEFQQDSKIKTQKSLSLLREEKIKSNYAAFYVRFI